MKSALRDSKIKRFVALVWSMLALTPVKKSTALLQTSITFVPSLQLGYFFCLNRSRIRQTFRKTSRRERFANPVARCCVDCRRRRFLACFCLYRQAGVTRNPTGWHRPGCLYSLNSYRPRLRNPVSYEQKIYPVLVGGDIQKPNKTARKAMQSAK